MSELRVGERVRIRRDRYGYKVNNVFYRRTTTLNDLPKPWMGRWAASETAISAVANAEAIQVLTSKMTDEELAAAVAALREKDYNHVAPAAKALYQTLKDAPWQKRDNAADHGTAVHATLEALAKGEPLPDILTNEEELACAIQAESMFRQMLGETGQVLGVEVSVVNPHVRVPYAGTYDLRIRDASGTRWQLDYKTSGGGPYSEWVTQQVAYFHAPYALVDKQDFEQPSKTVETWTARVEEQRMEDVDRIGLVHISPTFARLYPVNPEVLDRAWMVFRAAGQCKMWNLDTDDYRREPRLKVFLDAVHAA